MADSHVLAKFLPSEHLWPEGMRSNKMTAGINPENIAAAWRLNKTIVNRRKKNAYSYKT
jgi:hypothetical protein